MSAVSKSTMTYVAKAPCGCIRAACIDVPGDEKETAKLVADYVKRKLAVSHVLHETVKTTPWGCEVCDPKEKKQGELPL